MDLLLWRHADADPGGFDLERELTAKGHQQAARVAAWLRARLPAKLQLIVSPAVRAQQTAKALAADFATAKELAPGAAVATILKTAGWPHYDGTVVVVGHQPEFGRVAAYLASGKEAPWHIDKAAVWWFSNEGSQPVVRAVVSPDLL
jgi:phosphohistidine phosphatase